MDTESVAVSANVSVAEGVIPVTEVDSDWDCDSVFVSVSVPPVSVTADV